MNSISQSLMNVGMTAVTNYPLDTSTDYVLHVYDTRNVVISAPFSANWSINTILPATNAISRQWKASRMGSVFGVTIDNLGNIFVASSFVYGPTPAGTAGPGGIYKVNAADGSVSDFVLTDPNPSSSSATKIPNTGPGLGNITYDKWHDQLFVTNFEDGKIYRVSMTGVILSRFDPFAPDNGLAGAPPYGDLPWGVGVYSDYNGEARVYFSDYTEDESVTSSASFPFDNNSVWSVALDQNGDFSGTERFEIAMPNYLLESYSNPVSSLNFSSAGKMLLSERSMENIGYTSAHLSRDFEYTFTGGAWNLSEFYNIGNYSTYQDYHSNSAGGADFAYRDSDPSDSLNGCEELIWTTGDALRFQGSNPDGGTDYVYGLTGIPEAGNSGSSTGSNSVCTSSYYIDLDNDVSDIPKSRIGSCAVFRNCIFNPCENYSCTLINVVTPNGDATNDKFSIDCIQSDGWKLEVYDRWGYRVFKSDNYHNDWDCKNLVEGVYYYILTTPCEKGKTFTGFFHLIR
ncbi:MAG: gliding motility-associated C-terminal domain-containing protein [Bacteroidetes bacterium]|nr:gliding motility-associated C-terminal domain-containing protein [Bacteroidota bacterium]